MSRIDDNNKLIRKVQEQLDSLLDEMGEVRADGTGAYAGLLAKGQSIFGRMANMNTMGNLGALKEIIDAYNSAIAVIDAEFKKIKNEKDENAYTEQDVKGLEDLLKISKDSKFGSRSGHEMAAVMEYSSRQKENQLFSQDAIMEIDKKINREQIYINNVKDPIENAKFSFPMQQLFYKKYCYISFHIFVILIL